MDNLVLAIYGLCDDLSKALQHQESPQRLMNVADFSAQAQPKPSQSPAVGVARIASNSNNSTPSRSMIAAL